MNTNYQNNLIIWQKWVDPFIGEDPSDYIDRFDSSENNMPSDDEAYYQDETPQTAKSAIRVIATPMGIIPINENTLSSKVFNFWVGHTNFDITKQLAEIIEKTDGVETLDIFTRYRFRIAVGKAFDDSVVMRDINQRAYKCLASYDKNT